VPSYIDISPLISTKISRHEKYALTDNRQRPDDPKT